VNQDVTAGDPCWQCGATLGAPAVNGPDKGAGLSDSSAGVNTTATSSADATSDTPAANGQGQIQMQRPGRTDRLPILDRPARTMGPDYRAIIIAIAVIALIIAAAIYFATHHM
jgi:hypothetical protein